MKSYEWNRSDQSFVEVDDPIYDPKVESFSEALANAGYGVELSSEFDNSVGASVNLYATDRKDKPQFYLEIVGQSRSIASLVARNFPSLVETMRQIQPLIALTGLDQQASMHIENRLDREEEAKKKR